MVEPTTAAEDMFRGLLESAPDPIVIVDERGLVRIVNRQTESIFGYGRDELLGSPIYLPNDPAIPAKGVPAKAQMTRPIGSDHHILQREAKSSSGILPIVAYVAVLAIALGLCVLMGWGLARLARDGREGIQDDEQPTGGEAWIARPPRERQPTPA